MKPSFLAPLLKLIRNFKPSVKARLCHTPCVFVLIGFKNYPFLINKTFRKIPQKPISKRTECERSFLSYSHFFIFIKPEYFRARAFKQTPFIAHNHISELGSDLFIISALGEVG